MYHSAATANIFKAEIMFVYYKCLKTGFSFQLKCSTSFPLMYNVVYKFSCSRDAKISYFGMTTQIFFFFNL